MYLAKVWLKWFLLLQAFRVGLHDVGAEAFKGPPSVKLKASTADPNSCVLPVSLGSSIRV